MKDILERNLARREVALDDLPLPSANHPAVVALTEDLASDRTRASLGRDPYWPKWNTPWWKMLLLLEMGLPEAIPAAAAEALAERFEAHYLHDFPFRMEDVPPGFDPHRKVMCHCGLGSVYRIMSACRIDIDGQSPWVRPWFRQFQLPDGGLNCDEEAYLKDSPRSSMLSTLPPLEAILETGIRNEDERRFVDEAARYILDRRLFRSRRNPERIVLEEWLEPTFPRFYNYDVLRGLTALSRWAEITGTQLAQAAISEALSELESRLDAAGRMAVRREWLKPSGTRDLSPDGSWSRLPEAYTFPLLEEASRRQAPSPWLTREWYDTVARLDNLQRIGQLV